MIERSSGRRPWVCIAIIFSIGVCQPAAGIAAGIGVECLAATGMDVRRAAFVHEISGSDGAPGLRVAIRAGKIDLARAVLACSYSMCLKKREPTGRFNHDVDSCLTFQQLDVLVEMADNYDQDDIKKLLKQHRTWWEDKIKQDK